MKSIGSSVHTRLILWLKNREGHLFTGGFTIAILHMYLVLSSQKPQEVLQGVCH